jgi:8-oxo-dGTP diphosphatase
MTRSKKYVNGFLFDSYGEYVTLIEKAKPEWQAGLLNGVGGKVESGETFEEAMTREFLEEAGVEVLHEGPYGNWTRFMDLKWEEKGGGICVFYRAFSTSLQDLASTQTDEPINAYSVEDILSEPYLRTRVIPNLHWLLPMALDDTQPVGACTIHTGA